MSQLSAGAPATLPDPSGRRLAQGLLVSLLLHAVVLSLQFGVRGLRAGSDAPLTVSLAPPPASIPTPTVAVPPPSEPVVQAPLPPATGPAPAPALEPQPARQGFTLRDPVVPAPLPPAPAPAPTAREPRRTPRRRVRPAPERVAPGIDVIASTAPVPSDFDVPLPQVEPAAEPVAEEVPAMERVEPEVAPGDTGAAREAARLRAQEQEREQAQERERQRLAQQQAEEAAERERAEALARRQAAERERSQQIAEQRRREEQQRQQIAERERLEQAERERAQQLAEQRRREEQQRQQVAERERLEQAERERSAEEALRAERARDAARQAADAARRQAEQEGRMAQDRAEAGPSGRQGAGGALPRDALGSDMASRARELMRGIDVGKAVPDVLRPAEDAQRGARRALAETVRRDAPLRLYADSVRQKIERNAVLSQAQLSNRDMQSDPVVSVTIRSDGSIEDVVILRSSGRPDVDEIVRRIVRVNARYSAFPPNVAAQYDVVELRRVWRFAGALRLVEEVR